MKRGWSFIYSNIHIYRLVMNILYKGKYEQRAKEVFSLFHQDVKNVTELCFGDIVLAALCKNKGIAWIGFDGNEDFVKYAQCNGYNSVCSNLPFIKLLPCSDVCVMMGSLYHFHGHEEEIISAMIKSAPVVIISEPVGNISSSKGILGRIARWASRTNSQSSGFRYTEKSLMTLFDNLSGKLRFRHSIVGRGRDIIVKLSID
jgi:hypothetical protein